MSVATINWNGLPGSTPDANSCQITYAAGDVLFDATNPQTFPAGAVSTAIKDFLVGHGWTYVAVTTPLAAGKYLFTAPNLLDPNLAASVKTIVVDFSTTGGFVLVKSYESVNSSTGALLNPTYLSDVNLNNITVSSHTTGIAANSGKIWLGASARHLVATGLCGGAFTSPCGVFETTRVSVHDTISMYPKHHSLSYLYGSATAQSFQFISPRTHQGVATAVRIYVVSNYGCTGLAYSSTPCQDLMPGTLNPLSGGPVCSNLTLHAKLLQGTNGSPALMLGTLINFVALTTGYGSIIGDDITIPLTADSNFAGETFVEATGTPTSHWILGVSNARFAVPK